jgi:glycerol-3-phosphate dehydrogenase
VRRLFEHRYAYIFQNEDKRVLFAIPYEQDFTLLGTTDVEYRGDPAAPAIEAGEVSYLCQMANRYFRRQISAADVVWSYSGVRPLLDDHHDDPAGITRDYALDLDTGSAPLLSVFGGKLTTFRRLAEEALAKIAPRLGCRGRPWTAHALLPGGKLPGGSFAAFLRALERRYPWLPAALRQRLAHAYGDRAQRVLGAATSIADLGEEVVPDLYEREIEYLRRCEWARTAEDILWRRTKLGLHSRPDSTRTLDAWLASHPLEELRLASGP